MTRFIAEIPYMLVLSVMFNKGKIARLMADHEQ